MAIQLTVSIILLLWPIASRSQQTEDSQTPLIISGPRVIFFSPSKAEVDSVVRVDGVEIADILDEYEYESGKAAYYLSILKVPVEFTTSRIVLVKLSRNRVRRFDRTAIPDPVGMILTDGDQEPALIAGPRDNSQLISEINRFFRIE